MQIEKLFHVLVVGGSLLAGSAIATSDAPAPVNSDTVEVQVATPELQPIFCNQEGACVTESCGHKHVKPGFECCWGTSCDQQ